MRQYKVFLIGWAKDLDTSLIVNAVSISQAKAIYKKIHLLDYVNAGYPKSEFVKSLRVQIIS
jgi:hypothetical protein